MSTVSDRGVRPFVLTHGRTAPRGHVLKVETLVVASAEADDVSGVPERRRIVELCRSPLSVAEIAAGLRVPIGVARVLVADLADDGLIRIRTDPAPVDRVTLERILDRVGSL